MFSLCPEYQEENKAIFQLAIEITTMYYNKKGSHLLKMYMICTVYIFACITEHILAYKPLLGVDNITLCLHV